MPFSIHILSLQSHQLVFLHHLNRESAIVSAPRFLWIIPQRCWNWKKNGKPKHTIPHRRVFLTTRRAPFSFETALNTNHARRDSHLVEPSFVPPKDRRLLPTWKQLPVIVSRSSLPVQSLSNNNSWQEKVFFLEIFLPPGAKTNSRLRQSIIGDVAYDRDSDDVKVFTSSPPEWIQVE